MKQRKALEIKNLSKHFGKEPSSSSFALNNINFDLKKGEVSCLIGPSGSGKTTLLQLIGLLDSPSGGEILIDNTPTYNQKDSIKTKIRKDKIGFIYQFHHLLPEFHALDNVAMALRIGGENKQVAREKSAVLLKQFGLEHRLNHRPAELSGGERQRVAIARAMVTNPKAILADEPTGNLDQDTADQVFESLIHSKAANKSALIIVTHSMELARKCSKVLRLEKGELKAE